MIAVKHSDLDGDSRDGRGRMLGSVARALQVLELLAVEPSGELGVTQVAQRLRVGKSTAHQILATLLAHEFVGQDSRSSRYHLGSRAIGVGTVALQRAGLGGTAQPILEEVAAAVRETVSIAVLAGTEVLLVQRVDAPTILRVDLRVGSRLPAHQTSMGRVLLAGLPPRRRAELLDQMSLEPGERQDVEEAVCAADRDGYAIVRDTPYVGISGVSAPVRDHSGQVVAVLCITGPSTRFDPQAHRETAMEAAGRLSTKLGSPRKQWPSDETHPGMRDSVVTGKPG